MDRHKKDTVVVDARLLVSRIKRTPATTFVQVVVTVAVNGLITAALCGRPPAH